MSAHDIHPTFCSLEKNTLLVLFVVGTNDLYAVGVFVLDAEVTVHVPESVIWIFGPAFDLNRAGVFCPHSPLGNVVVVAAPACNHTGAIVLDSQPARSVVAGLRMDALFGISGPGCRA